MRWNKQIKMWSIKTHLWHTDSFSRQRLVLEIHPEGVRLVLQMKAFSSINEQYDVTLELSSVLQIKCGLCIAVSSGSVTVNADSSVQLLAEEAVPLDSLDLAVSPFRI